MVQFVAGVMLGVFFCAAAGIVGCCIYIEKKYPKTLAKFRAEMLETEGDIW